MTRFTRLPNAALALALRTLVFSMVLAAPVLAVPSIGFEQTSIIEAPAPKKTGVGFVLLTILQRR